MNLADRAAAMSNIKKRMTTGFAAIFEDALVREAVEFLRRKKSELKDRFIYAYMVNREGKLAGVLQLRDLLLAEPEQRVRDIAFLKPIYLRINDSEETAAELFRKHPFLALPVVDEKGNLAGVVTATDVADIIRVESNRMLHHFAGMSGEEIEGKSILRIVSRRLPWLLLSMVSGLMCAYILGVFIEEIESVIALVLFIPIVLGVAGGVGVQSSVITLRGLREGKLRLSAIGRVLVKEIAIGCLIGLISCIVITAIALCWQKDLILGFALGVSIAASVVASGVLGVMLPLILKGLRLDPAFASGLFVLVICDIFVMIIYFTLASAIINPAM